jgi:hypothetical protein
MLDLDSSGEQITELKQYFGVQDIEKMLVDDYQTNECIFNAFGRPIFPSTAERHVLFNNFVQSSAAECAVLGFSNLCESLRGLGVQFEPMFVIHDALMVDISKSSRRDFMKVIDAGVETPLGMLPLKATNVSGGDI